MVNDMVNVLVSSLKLVNICLPAFKWITFAQTQENVIDLFTNEVKSCIQYRNYLKSYSI